jgi:hypothetical protein
MLPVLIFYTLIQLGPSFKVGALPNIWPRSLQSSFVEPSRTIGNKLAINELLFNSLNRRADAYLWRTEWNHPMSSSLSIESKQSNYGKTACKHNLPKNEGVLTLTIQPSTPEAGSDYCADKRRKMTPETG